MTQALRRNRLELLSLLREIILTPKSTQTLPCKDIIEQVSEIRGAVMASGCAGIIVGQVFLELLSASMTLVAESCGIPYRATSSSFTSYC